MHRCAVHGANVNALQAIQLQLQQQKQQLERLEVICTRQPSAVMSLTEVGRTVVRTAKKANLVPISSGAAAAAVCWRAALEPDVRAQLDAAASPDSKLGENGAGGVQDLFNSLLPHQPRAAQPGMPAGLTGVYVDTHTRQSVCGDCKPDCICSMTAVLLPSSTKLILELKAQGMVYNSDPHMGKVGVPWWGGASLLGW